MALVVEDGTGIAGANTYLSVAELRAYAVDRGVILPAQDSDVAVMLVKACDYLELKSYIGVRASDSQGLSWPRLETSYTGIPEKLKTAQTLLAFETANGDLSPAVRPNPYIQTKISDIYIKYASTSDVASGMRFYAVDSLLEGLLSISGGRPLVTVRA